MKFISRQSIKDHQTHGYKVIRLGKFFALVRKYSIYCNSSWWKRNLPIYCLVRIEREEEEYEY